MFPYRDQRCHSSLRTSSNRRRLSTPVYPSVVASSSSFSPRRIRSLTSFSSSSIRTAICADHFHFAAAVRSDGNKRVVVVEQESIGDNLHTTCHRVMEFEVELSLLAAHDFEATRGPIVESLSERRARFGFGECRAESRVRPHDSQVAIEYHDKIGGLLDHNPQELRRETVGQSSSVGCRPTDRLAAFWSISNSPGGFTYFRGLLRRIRTSNSQRPAMSS